MSALRLVTCLVFLQWNFAFAERTQVEVDASTTLTFYETAADYRHTITIDGQTINFDLPHNEFTLIIPNFAGKLEILSTNKQAGNRHSALRISVRTLKDNSRKARLMGFWKLATAYGSGETNHLYDQFTDYTKTMMPSDSDSQQLNIAKLHMIFREIDQAEAIVDPIIEKLPSKPSDRLQALIIQSEVHQQRNDQKERLKTLDVAITLVQPEIQPIDQFWHGYLLNEKCDALIRQRKREYALTCLEKALQFGADWPLIEARALNAKGGYFAELPYSAKESIEHFEAAEIRFKKINATSSVANSQYNRGVMLSQQGHYDQALGLLFSAYDNLQGDHNPFLKGNIIAAIGGIYIYLENYIHARQFLESGMQQLRAGVPDRTIMAIKSNLGTAKRELGNTTEALRLHQEYADYMANSLSGSWRHALAQLDLAWDQLALGNFDEAHAQNSLAQELLKGEHDLHRAAALLNLAQIHYAQGAYQLAIDTAKEAYDLNNATDTPRPQTIQVLNLLLAANYHIKNFDRATYYGKLAISAANTLISTMENSEIQTYFRGTLHDIYPNLAAVKVRQFDEAQDTALLEEAFNLLQQGRANPATAIASSDTDNSLEEQIARSLDRGDFADAANRRVLLNRKRFQSQHPNSPRRSEPTNYTLRQLQQGLGNTELFIDYIFSDFASFRLTISNEKISYANIRNRDDVSRDISTFLGAVSERKFDYQLAKTLGNELIGGIQRQHPNIQHLKISPVSTINHLPLSALDISEGDTYDPLIKHFSIVLAVGFNPDTPAATQYDTIALVSYESNVSTPAPTSLTPEVRSWSDNLASLPWATEEVSVISKIFTGASTVLTGNSATLEEIAMLGETDILHFATHGYISPIDPDLAGLILNETLTDKNAFVGWRSFSRYAPAARLVYLNGCETGRGVVVKGEGVFGLVRAFIANGTPDVVATRWRISDRAAYELTREFYTQLTNGKAPHIALQLAKQSLIRKPLFRKPYYWASHALYSTTN